MISYVHNNNQYSEHFTNDEKPPLWQRILIIIAFILGIIVFGGAFAILLR